MLGCMFWHDLVIYGLEQGYGQLKMVQNAQPISEIMQNQSISDSVKQKINFIGEIKKYAIDSLGINQSENYSTFFDQGKTATLLTFSACEPYAFKAKEWTFPFLGTVSYKGYFNIEKAKKEIAELKMQGYDVDAYSPSGWSTLGWFKDPVLSGMLKQQDGSLANLIIHELTHGTLFVKNDVTFNENLASFIGDKGAEMFLVQYFGRESAEYIEYENAKEDVKLYDAYILKSTDRLDSLYQLMGRGVSEETIKTKKKQVITEIVLGVYKLPLHKKSEYFKYTLQAFKEGNAFFMSFRRYDSQYALFDNEYRKIYNSDLKKYLSALKQKYPSL